MFRSEPDWHIAQHDNCVYKLPPEPTPLPSLALRVRLSQRERWRGGSFSLREKVRMRVTIKFILQIASPVLLLLERLEQRFEIALAETLGAFALNDFKEERRPIFDRLGEYL